MKKSITELAKEFNAEVYEETSDEKGTGKLMRKFEIDEYEDSMILVDNLNGYVDYTTEEYSLYLSGERDWLDVIPGSSYVESIIEFKNGVAVAASYAYVNGNTASSSFEDDTRGVLDFWKTK